MVGELGRNMKVEVVRRGWGPVSGSLAWPSSGPEIIIGTRKNNSDNKSNNTKKRVIIGSSQVVKKLDSDAKRSSLAIMATY